MTSLATLLWAALVAQAPDTSAKQRVIDALKTVDDTLTAVRGSTAEFRVDLSGASPDLVRARVGRVHAHCSSARVAIAPLRAALAADLYTPNLRSKRAVLRDELTLLDRALVRCEREWNSSSAVPADSLKAWGPFRAAQLEAALRRYDRHAGEFRTAARNR